MPEYEFWLNHCRNGITLALQSLNLAKECKVGVMVYNCHTVMNSVRQAGYECEFIDVTDELKINFEDLNRKVKKIKVLIISHLFGIVNDINKIKKANPDIIIIEDCAHIFGKQIEGDFGVYSVGQGKFPSIGDGGILVVNNTDYLNSVIIKYHEIDFYNPKDEISLYVKLRFNSLLYKPLIYKYFTLFVKSINKKKIKFCEEPIKKMSQGVANLVINKRNKMPIERYYHEQNAKDLIEKFGFNDYLLGENAFMLIVKCKCPKELKQQMYKFGIDTETHFQQCIEWAKRYGYKRGCCPNAERLTNELLMFPTYKKIE